MARSMSVDLVPLSTVWRGPLEHGHTRLLCLELAEFVKSTLNVMICLVKLFGGKELFTSNDRFREI